jgi:hypothetical protein
MDNVYMPCPSHSPVQTTLTVGLLEETCKLRRAAVSNSLHLVVTSTFWHVLSEKLQLSEIRNGFGRVH